MIRIILFVLLFVYANVNAQMRPSERRQQQQENKTDPEKKLTPSEKRKKAEADKNRMDIYGSDDPLFNENKIPEKWQNESAVILYQKFDYSYLRDNKTIEIDEIVRRKVKLIDRAAVTEFSEFYFLSFTTSGLYYSGNSEIGIRIMKSDGREIPVEVDAAVVVDDDLVPPIFRSFYSSNQLAYKKLAIPDLQEGDIIDYYYKTHRSIKDLILNMDFDPFYFTLNSTYPILNQKISFTVDRGFYINFNSYNGAPQLQEGDAGTDLHGRKRALIKTYSLTDSNREKRPDDVWEYYFRDNPTVKFQVVYETSSSKNTTRNFIGEIGVAKRKVGPEEINVVLTRSVRDESGVTFADDILKHLNKNFPNEKDPEKIARESYYLFRKVALEFIYEGVYAIPGKGKEEIIRIDEEKFVSALLQVFKKKNIDAYVIATTPAHLGNIDEILIGNEMTLAVMVKGKKPIYLFPFTNHSTFNTPQSGYQNVDAYAFKLSRNARVVNYEKVVLPEASPDENILNMQYTVNIDGAMENLSVVRNVKASGAYKSSYIERAMYNYDYLIEDKQHYNPNYKATAPKGNKNKVAEEKRKVESKSEELQKNQYKFMQNDLEDDFDVLTYDNYSLVNSGRYDDKPILEYNENFKLKNLLNKAGKNYILEAGKLIGKQFELKEKQMVRTTDYYNEFARTITNEIRIQLPDGYTVDGIADLNFNIDNTAAAFISKVKTEGNVLVINTSKVYKKTKGSKEEWKNVVDVLEAAYKFTQKKIVLKKA